MIIAPDKVDFSRVSNRIYLSFALSLQAIGLKISRYFAIQSEVRKKPVVTRSARSRTFSRTSRQLQVFTLSFDWFPGFSV